MKQSLNRVFGGFVLLALVAALVAVSPSDFGKKPKGKLIGKYFENTSVFAEGKVCRVDSGAGTLVRFDQNHENPLFQSKLPNMTHLILWFKDGLMTGQRYEIPSPAVQVCYWEQGDLLMFHTTKGLGWVEFAVSDGGQPLKGKMDLKLIEPDHNMSNSDYHYMGGSFTATLSKER
jgi:hypothetical protein